MRFLGFLFTCILLFSFIDLVAQNRAGLLAKKASEAITIDGQADEAIWAELDPAKDFYQYSQATHH